MQNCIFCQIIVKISSNLLECCCWAPFSCSAGTRKIFCLHHGDLRKFYDNLLKNTALYGEILWKIRLYQKYKRFKFSHGFRLLLQSSKTQIGFFTITQITIVCIFVHKSLALSKKYIVAYQGNIINDLVTIAFVLAKKALN